MVEDLVLKDHNWEAKVFFQRILLGFSLVVLLALLLLARLFFLRCCMMCRVLQKVNCRLFNITQDRKKHEC